MTHDDVISRFRLRALALAGELGNVRAACRALGIHPSTYYRWKALADRHGLELLRPRERRRPAMPNAISPMIEQRVLALALAHPGFGPRRIADELARERWGATPISSNGVWKVLARHGLSTRARRYALVAGYAAPPERDRPPSQSATSRPIFPASWCRPTAFLSGASRAPAGRSGSTPPSTWPRAICGLSSIPARATRPPATPRPWPSGSPRIGRARLCPRGDLDRQRLGVLGPPVHRHPGEPGHRAPAHPRRPAQSNGCVERVQRTILEECWRPAFARHLIPKLTGLRRELERFVDYYNTDRAHHGRLTKGRTPDEVLGKAAMWERRR